LQEIKTIGKRIEKKRQNLGQYVARDARVKDPLEREGGSVEFIKRERQALADLEKRIVAIRTAIQRSNLSTSATVGDITQSVAEWLTWRREISAGAQAFLNQLGQGIRAIRDKIQKSGGNLVVAQSEGDAKPGDVVVHLEEKALLEEQEKFETILGELDGKLSLLNATTIVEV
jgi:hypothetical protein